jgi:hypothetical protein
MAKRQYTDNAAFSAVVRQMSSKKTKSTRFEDLPLAEQIKRAEAHAKKVAADKARIAKAEAEKENEVRFAGGF